MSSLADQLALLFEARGYTWKIGGESTVPSSDDIQKVIEKAVETLDKTGSDDIELETGRLIFRRYAGHTDLYVYFGSI